MNAVDCLDQAGPAASTLMLEDGPFALLVVLIIMAIVMATALSPLLRRAFLHRVTRLMGLNQVRPRPDGWWNPPYRTLSPSEPAATDNTASAQLHASALAWEQRVTRATGIGWLIFVLAAIPVAGWSNPSMAWGDRLGFATFAGLLALWPALVNLPPRWTRKATYLGLAVLALVALTAVIGEESGASARSLPEEETFEWWVIPVALGLGAAYLALFRRSLRGLVLPLAVVLSVFMLVFVFPLALMESRVGSCLATFTPGSAEAASAPGAHFWTGTFSMLGATLAMLGLWFGFWVVGRLALLVERGWLDELSMAAAIGLVITALMMVFGNVPDELADQSALAAWLPLPWVLGSIAAFVVALGKRPKTAPGPQLLVLRVFSRDRRQQALLDRLQSRWRYVGTVNQAGGPDMVDLNVDPYECAMFLSSRLHDIFLPAAVSKDQLRGRLNTLPDHGGRYRINEVFNFNTAWRSTVEQLVQISDAILLDLRGLTPEREGTCYEIGLLAKNGKLARVVAVGDDTTDWPHVDRLLAEAGASADQLKRLDLDTDPKQERLFLQLLEKGIT